MMAQYLSAKSGIAAGIVAAVAVTSVFPLAAHATYDPKHGRWLQRDPIGVRVDAKGGAVDAVGRGMSLGIASRHDIPLPQQHQGPPQQHADGMNLYQYARSRSMIMIDPHGLRGASNYIHRMTDCPIPESPHHTSIVAAANRGCDCVKTVRDIFMDDAKWQKARTQCPNVYPISIWTLMDAQGKSSLASTRMREDVGLNLRMLASACDDGFGVKCECKCTEGTFGYVDSIFDGTNMKTAYGDIHLCPIFFTDPKADQPGTIIHELSHKALHLDDDTSSGEPWYWNAHNLQKAVMDLCNECNVN